LVALSAGTGSFFAPFWVSVPLLLFCICGGVWCLSATFAKKHSSTND
jgi:hypothetical protein